MECAFSDSHYRAGVVFRGNDEHIVEVSIERILALGDRVAAGHFAVGEQRRVFELEELSPDCIVGESAVFFVEHIN